MAKDINKEEPQITRNIQEVIIDNPRTALEKVVWINVTNAGKKELEYLRKKFGYQLSHLQLASSNVFSQRPAIVHSDGYIFTILHFPIMVNGSIAATEVDFFFGHGYLITIHNGNIQPLNDFFSLCKKDGNSLLSFKNESSSVLLYELLEKLMQACYPLLDQLSLEVTRVQEMIFQQDSKKAVTEILQLRYNITNFHKIMHSHKKIITKIMELRSTIIPTKQIEGYYKKLIEHSITIWEILENQKETIDILNGTNESLLNYRLSEIMKTLTIFSIISFYLTFIAAVFAMRAEGMPLIDQPNSFWIIIGIMSVVALSIVFIFSRKKWL
jgi:magnesium transporter